MKRTKSNEERARRVSAMIRDGLSPPSSIIDGSATGDGMLFAQIEAHGYHRRVHPLYVRELLSNKQSRGSVPSTPFLDVLRRARRSYITKLQVRNTV